MRIEVFVNASLKVVNLTRTAELVADVGAGFLTSDATCAIQQHFFVLELTGVFLDPCRKFAEACSARINSSFEVT